MVYSATAGISYDLASGKALGASTPEIDEFNWGETEPSLVIQIHGLAGNGYQAMPISIEKALTK